MDPRKHWEDVYGRKRPEATSWYRPHLETSLDWIERAGLPRDAAIIDVGAGASTLVDDLLDRGYTNLTVLDISAQALAVTQARLGDRGKAITWIEADVTTAPLPTTYYDFWHDRAVFHFLTDPAAQRAYIRQVQHALKPGGHIVVATFGLEGPEKCSGLDVVRYDAEGIHREFGGEFVKVGDRQETHTTPSGTEQEFVYCYCRKA